MNICRIPIKRKSLKFLICKLNFDPIPYLKIINIKKEPLNIRKLSASLKI